ncbi:MAG TPA: hypothetical protein VFL38_17890 [Humibacillus xanthopallidus]|nr:hypothetical protein [Humibacillus xanthopallidus]
MSKEAPTELPGAHPGARAENYARLGSAAWRWVLDQVEWDDRGPWIPDSVDLDGGPAQPSQFPQGLHSGVSGLVHALREIGLTRELTDEESRLVHGAVHRLRAESPVATDVTYFDGLSSTVGTLVAADGLIARPASPRERPDGGVAAPTGVDTALLRMLELLTLDGWPTKAVGPPGYTTDARVHDATTGTAGVLLAAVWAMRHGAPAARELADRCVDVLLAEAETMADGVNWPMVADRHRLRPRRDMPNWSHGLAGIASALALAGSELERPDVVEQARRGAEHLVGLRVPDHPGLALPHLVPAAPELGLEPIAYGWCHGPTGTSLLFRALDGAGVDEVVGEHPLSWHRRCLDAIHASGIPERLRPGFWDNDGRCCGTAGVGDMLLDAWTSQGDPRDLALAVRLGDALVEHAVVEGDRAYWRSVEHRNDDPLLPPAVGWMQGATGIVTYLYRLGRVLDSVTDGGIGGVVDRPVAIGRMDNWWALTPRG